jgi:predicted transcriptional regulator
MYTNCNEIFKVTIPAVRIAVAKSLNRKYKMNQSDIAKQLGTTQAAISKYFNGNYSDNIAKVEKIVEKEKALKEITAMIVTRKDKRSITMGIDKLASSGHLVRETLKIL